MDGSESGLNQTMILIAISKKVNPRPTRENLVNKYVMTEGYSVSQKKLLHG